MSNQNSYQIRAPKVECQIIDGEALFIDFDSGAYFSANKSGSLIVGAVSEGLPAGEIARLLGEAFGSQNADMLTEVNSFLDHLLAENLIEQATASAPKRDGTEIGATVLAGTLFESPALEKYTDLEQMLLLDPIHDVDREGWPAQKPLDDES